MSFMRLQKELRTKFMPSGNELAKLSQKSFTIDKLKIEEDFNFYLKHLLKLEFEIYKKKEKECSTKIIKEAIKKGFLKDRRSFSSSFKQNYDELWEFFLSISQSRKTRAGGSFEKHVKYLFELLHYPFDTQTVLNGKVDYVIPRDAFKKNRTSCVVISIKRTLRERWRQVIGELTSTNAGKIYILTADEEISYPKVEEMKSHNVNLVVWDEYKIDKFQQYFNVLGFNQFIQIDLPSSRKMWERLL